MYYMRILAIESSCDETAIALLNAQSKFLNLEKNEIYSQIDIHKKYGGVIPEIAARKHLETIIPLLEDTLGKNKFKNIDYLAVTAGPGLVTSLLLGLTAAKTLAYVNKLPLVAVNHLEGHIYSNWLASGDLVKNPKKFLPALVLVVSGGHTELVLMEGYGQYQLIGQTLDDAAGEAYDKVAKLLSLGYPGGPIVSRWADKGNSQAYNLPRPMISNANFNFSFSGLKTAVLYTLEKKKNINKKDIADICASFQAAVVEVLVAKTMRAAKKHQVKSVMLAGGVAANKVLQAELAKESQKQNLPFFYPTTSHTGDNAAMIAVAAYYNIVSRSSQILPPKGRPPRGRKGRDILKLEPQANWQLGENKI